MRILLVILTGILLLTGCAGNGDSAMANDGDTVKIHYTGTLEDGSVFDTSRGQEPLEFTLGEGTVIPGFEEAVKGMQVGQTKTVMIPAEEAYGPYRDELVMVIEQAELPEGLDPAIGQRLPMRQEDGRTAVAVITDVSETTITIDANHSLAGQDLTFDLELVEIK